MVYIGLIGASEMMKLLRSFGGLLFLSALHLLLKVVDLMVFMLYWQWRETYLKIISKMIGTSTGLHEVSHF